MSKRRGKQWWPGMYEGKSPGETYKTIGKSAPPPPPASEAKTPDCLMWQRIAHKLERGILARY